MYSFEPTDEQRMLIETVQRYAGGNLRPVAREADEAGEIPGKLVDKGWELGLLQASVPESYGGFGEYSALTSVLAVEEMAWGDLSGTLAVLTPSLFAVPLLLAGSEEQKETFLPSIIEAEWKPFSAALVEPHFDFDPLELRTKAVATAGGYVLTGEKCYVPFADKARAMLVYADLDGKTQAFIVPSTSAGLQVGPRQALMGVKALPLFSVSLNQVEVRAEDRLGGENGHEFGPILNVLRLGSAATGLGVARAAFEYARDYAKDREAFGVKIAQKQAVAFMLAEMATEIEAMRLLVWEAAWAMDKNLGDASKLAYLAFTGAADMAMQVTDRAVQILGGHGYIREHPVEMWMRNGRGIAALTGLAIV